MFLVQETWLEPGIDPQIANYRLTKDDRIEIPHTVTRGGTAIYCKNEIVHHRVPLPKLKGLDATAVQIKINNFPPINIVSAYVRRRVGHSFPIEDFKKIFNSGSNCIIAGDYNAAHVSWQNAKSTRFGQVLHKLIRDLQGAKLVAPQTATHSNRVSEQLSTNWFNFKFALKKKPLPTVELTSNDNIELAISELNQNFTEAFVEASKPKFNNAPKILSPEIKFKIYQRNRLRKFWQRTRCLSIYSEFRTLSRDIAKDIQAYSRDQWEKHIEALSPVDNTLWRKSSLLRKPFQSIPPLKGALGSIAITPIEKAEVIADSLQEQFEPNHVVGRELFDQRIHDEVTNFINTPHARAFKKLNPPLQRKSYLTFRDSSPGNPQDLIRFLIVSCLDRHVVRSLSVHGSLDIDEAVGVGVNLFNRSLNRRLISGVWTVNSPQSHIVRVYDAGHGKSGVFHSAEWHDGDWSSDGIREAWLWFFIWWGEQEKIIDKYLEKCTTCIESEDLCDVLEEILVTLDDPDLPNTPERLRLVNSIQWTALKCSRKSIRLQNKEFKDYIRDIERLNRVPTEASPASQLKRKSAKRQPASPNKQTPSKKQAKSERKLPPTSTSPRHIEGAESSMEEGETSAEESSDEVSKKPVKPVIAPSSPVAKAVESTSAPGTSEKDDGFTFVGRSGRRIAPIVIDSQSNATELLDQLGKFCDTPLEGRFENGKLRVFPASAEEHRLIQKFISDKKLRSHTFEMAHNKQLKVVLRGLPTDFNQEELMSELHSFGFQSNHISLLRNRKTNTNMPLFLVTLPKSPESRGIFNIKTIGFFRVAVEPLNKSTMPPQCYRCQEFFHHSRFCARAPKCLKCSGGHLTSDCTKSAKAPAKCANCSGPHPANFSGCPRNPIKTKTNKSKSTKNAPHAILNVSNTFENSSVILQLGNNSKITVACIYRPPHGSINTTELDAILSHSNKAFLFGDFNARHPSWNPGRANSNGNILCNWAVGSALDILAPDTPTHFNSRHSNAILDIGFAVNLSHTEIFTINTLSSDHNPVIFDFVTNNVLPPILRTLKTTNWIKFQEIIYHTIPGNPRIDDLDLAVQNFTSNISNAISASTSTRLINTPHLRLPENIRELIRAKNRFRKLWNDTRYPPYKREVNALIRQIRREIQEHKNRTWKDFLLTLNPEDNSLYNLQRKFSKRHIPLPPLHGPGGMAYSDFEKAEAFKDTLEVTFQENEEPYCDGKIEEVVSV
ncbi:nucleic-acid-binding protein from transposon X-element [Trichonephila clavipes]|nr:nucleic-acid-binding protein from transposon X-element [Trichonephila clavipes]